MTDKKSKGTKRVRFIQELDYVELPVEPIVIDDDELRHEIADAIEKQREKHASGRKALPADNPTALLEELISPKALSDLEDIISVYVARQKFWADVVRRGDKDEMKIRKLGADANKLLDNLTTLQNEGLLMEEYIGSAHISHVQEVLTQLTKLEHENHGAFEEALPDLEQQLAWDLMIWWKRTTCSEPKFWSNTNGNVEDQYRSPFLRFVEAVIAPIPDDCRPTKSRGSAGFTRKPLQKKYKQLRDKEGKTQEFIEWLQRVYDEERRRRDGDQLSFEISANTSRS